MVNQAVVLCVLMVGVGGLEVKFPTGFEFGAASSAYQVEGAWNVSDKGESTNDRFIHDNHRDMNGDTTCDSYHNWRRDVEMAAEVGLDFYRFSISWARLLPGGMPNKISKDGTRYYNNLIDGLLAKGIKPLVTLQHFDLPQRLQDLGGWTNPLISDWFTDYARMVFQLFGDRVDTWITINEPVMVCFMGYAAGQLGPGLFDKEIAPYLCAKNALMSHAKTWRMYDEEFRPKFGGKLSLSSILFWMEPHFLDVKNNKKLTEIALQFAGIFSHPVYSKEGGWPPLIESLMAEKSRREGFEVSRLPPFTEEEKDFIKGTYDFYALNYYTGQVVRKAKPGEKIGFWPVEGLWEFDIILEGMPTDTPEGVYWFHNYPEGFRKTLKWIKDEYGDVDIFVTENGFPESVRDLNDENRIKSMREHLEQLLLAVTEDGVTVSKYTVWSLMDSYEWVGDYQVKFGLFDVDFSSDRRTRTARASAHYYADVIKSRALDVRQQTPKTEL